MTRKIKKLLKDFDISSFNYSGGMGGGEGGVSEDLLTTKGDTHGFSTLNSRVPIGIDDQVLTADSTDALGLAWKSAGGGTEFNDLTAVGTYSPTKQTGVMHVLSEPSIGSGTVKYYLDGVLTATYDSTSTGTFNELLNPSTSINWVAGVLTFADTSYTGNTGTVTSGGIFGDGQGCDVDPTGTYIVAVGSKRMLYWTASTPNDMSSFGSYSAYDTKNFDSETSTYLYGVKYMDSGAYIACCNGTTIYRVTTDNGAYRWTSNQCGTAAGRTSFNTSGTGSGQTYGIDFSASGDKMYIAHSNTADIIYEYDLGTDWDITSAVYNSISYTTGMSSSDMRQFSFSRDGVYLYTTTGIAGSTLLYRHTLSTPWDLSTASSTDNLNLSTLLGYSGAKLQVNSVYNNDASILICPQGSTGGGMSMYVINIETAFSGNFITAVS